jgi:hypothetical protein
MRDWFRDLLFAGVNFAVSLVASDFDPALFLGDSVNI